MPKQGSSRRRSVTPRVRHTCFDRIIPDDYHPARAEAERVAVAHAQTVARSMGPIVAGTGVIHPVRMAIVNAKKWGKGRTLNCRFLDGSPKQQTRVESKAHIWEQYANIKLKFVKSGDAEIRISFSADPGSWSAIGTDALVERYFPKFQPTMNYGWLEDDTADQEYERVVVHEFGHALGCVHEHQSPAETLKWNKPEVYRTFSGPPNYWSKADIDHNILQKYSRKGMRYTTFDINSIMLYQFDGSLFTDGKGTPLNTHLSDVDKSMIAQMYSKGG
jgi:hypothetical protein